MKQQLRNNYFYYGVNITREQFIKGVNEVDFEKWENSGEYREINDYTYGGYRATAVTDKDGNIL